jgi:hypothetical protein
MLKMIKMKLKISNSKMYEILEFHFDHASIRIKSPAKNIFSY